MTEKEKNKLRIELKRYAKSDEWKKIQDKCKNKDENIQNRILTPENDSYRYELKYSSDDILLEKLKVIKEIIEETTQESFREYLEATMEYNRQSLFTVYITKDGYSPCKQMYSEKDLDVVKAGEYRLIYQDGNRLDAIIGKCEKQTPKKREDLEVYEEA